MKKIMAVFLLTASWAINAASVGVEWDSSLSPPELISHYNIGIGTETGKYTKIINVGNVTKAVLTELEPGTAYYMAVAVCPLDLVKYQCNGYSNELSYTPPGTPLEIPKNFKLSEPLVSLFLTPTFDEPITKVVWTLPGAINEQIVTVDKRPVLATYENPGLYNVTMLAKRSGKEIKKETFLLSLTSL